MMKDERNRARNHSNTIVRFFVEVFHGAYLLELIIGAAVVVALAGGLYGYHWWSMGRARNAQKVLAECVQEFYQAQTGATTWSQVAQICMYGYEQHKNTSSGVYFLSMAAHAYARQNDLSKAIDLFDQAIKKLSASDPMKPLFEVKRALIVIDYAKKADHMAAFANSIAILERIAQSDALYGADEAAYQLGNYYWIEGNIQKARDTWQLLDKFKSVDSRGTSPYVALAEAKLEQVA